MCYHYTMPADQSGCPDSNRGPHAPKARALTGLRHTPIIAQNTIIDDFPQAISIALSAWSVNGQFSVKGRKWGSCLSLIATIEEIEPVVDFVIAELDVFGFIYIGAWWLWWSAHLFHKFHGAHCLHAVAAGHLQNLII